VTERRESTRGLRPLLVVWSGQSVSTIGTLMTSLALAFWAFDITGRATELGLMVFFTFGPRILLGPFAGALADCFGWLARTGPDAGMGPFITLSCAVGMCVLVWGFSRRSIREIDVLVPDHDAHVSV
jgi:hypothetical protein